MKVPPVTNTQVFQPSFINKPKKVEVKQNKPETPDIPYDLFIKNTIEKPQLAVFKI